VRRLLLSTVSVVVLGVLVSVALAASEPFPETIPLPDGFQPEGIAIAPGGTFYVGSIPTGAIYSGSVKTGEGAILVPGGAGRAAIGIDYDHGRLFVAGGPTGKAFVYDAETGAELASYQLTSPPTFINDVVVTREGAFFTDSQKPFLYKIPIAPNGELGTTVEEIPLTGDYVHVPGAFNANGIDATPNGKTLVIVQSSTGMLFTVDPETGVTREIDLGGETVRNGDGILLDGKTLYVVQNRLNLIAVVELSPDLSSGTVVARVTDDDFAVPTTIDEFGNRLYAVNARFGTPPTPTTKYWIAQLRKP
jgi:sugar lactone lactonase YvrE